MPLAEQADANALYILGVNYLFSREGEQDFQKAAYCHGIKNGSSRYSMD